MRRGAFLLVALVLAGCGGEAAGPNAEQSASEVASAEREPAPPVAGTTLTGADASLADLRGKPVFVNVWASW